MIKYAIIQDELTGLCNVGIGTDDDYYISIGMRLMDVEQSDIDDNWYLADKCPMKSEEEKELEEKERVAKLSMTKYDFYKYVCKPYGITYPTLLQFVNSNDDIAAAWDLCARVYRGDELLCANITRFVPAVTADVLDVIFKEYGE